MMETKWGELLVINQKQCRELITDQEVVELVEQVLIDFSNGQAVNPLKLHMPFFPDYNGWNNAMPGWLKKQDMHGIKWAGFGEENSVKHKLPQCSAVIVLNDMDTAFPYALLDGTTIMALRTGAAAAIMAKYCARKNAKTMTLIGAGVQGRSALSMCMIAMPQLEEIRIMDLRAEAMESVAKEFSAKHPEKKFVVCPDMHQAIRGADVVMTAVHAPGNKGGDVLDDCAFDPGVTVVSIAGGVSMGKRREMFDRIILDYIDCYVHRFNQSRDYMRDVFGQDVPLLTADIADGEIGDVITGKIPGRNSDDEKLYVAGVGLAIEDLIVADKIYQRAKARDIGVVVDVINDIER